MWNRVLLAACMTMGLAMSQGIGSFLGVGIQEIDSVRAKELKLPDDAGVEVTRIAPDSPAEKAGIKTGDVVTQYNGQRVEGLEHLPEQGPFVLVSNHVSYADSPALAAALGYRRLRQTYWAGWTGVAFRNPLFRLMSRLAQVVPIEQGRAALSSLAFGAAVLKRKKNLIWFPEGGFSPTGALQPFKPGIGLLLEHYPVPVVPVFLHGTRAEEEAGRDGRDGTCG